MFTTLSRPSATNDNNFNNLNTQDLPTIDTVELTLDDNSSVNGDHRSEDLEHSKKKGQTTNRRQQIEQAIAKLFREQEFDFFNWPLEKQILAGSIAGGIFLAVLPVVIPAGVLGLAGAAVGGIVALALYASVKTASYITSGVKWAAGKTTEGAKYVTEKTKEAYAAADQRVRKAASNALYSIAERAQAAAGATNYPKELQEIDDEQNQNFNAVKNLFKDIINGTQYKPKEKRDLIQTILKTIVSDIIKPKIEAEKAAGRKDGELYKRLNKQANFINGLNFQKLSKLLKDEKTSSIKDRYLIVSTFSEHRNDISEVILRQEEAALDAVIVQCNETARNVKNQLRPIDVAPVNEAKPRFFAKLFKPKAKAEPKSGTIFYDSDSGVESGAESETSRNENSRSSSNATNTHSADDAVNHNPLLLNRANSVSVLSQDRALNDVNLPLNKVKSVSDSSLNSSDSGVNSPGNSPKRMSGQDINQTRLTLRQTGNLERLMAEQRPKTAINQSIINQQQFQAPERGWAQDV